MYKTGMRLTQHRKNLPWFRYPHTCFECVGETGLERKLANIEDKPINNHITEKSHVEISPVLWLFKEVSLKLECLLLTRLPHLKYIRLGSVPLSHVPFKVH